MSEKKRLGKGLGALIPEVMEGTVETNEISLERIKPNPYQPRSEFNDDKLEELAASIKEHGVLQAVVVSPDDEGDGYTLVVGERRCRAARLAGLTAVPAVVKPVDRKTMLEVALIENLQREDLNPVEEAKAYRKLMQEYNYTQDELAQRIGRSRPSIANSVRLLSLPETILELLSKHELTPGQVRPLLSINDAYKQQLAAKQIMQEGLSAREAEKLASKMADRGENKKEVDRDQNAKPDPLQAEIQLQLQRCLGTKVRIRPGKNGGTIEVFYYGEEDLERLLSKLLPEGI